MIVFTPLAFNNMSSKSYCLPSAMVFMQIKNKTSLTKCIEKVDISDSNKKYVYIDYFIMFNRSILLFFDGY